MLIALLAGILLPGRSTGQTASRPADPDVARQREICFPTSGPAGDENVAEGGITVLSGAPISSDIIDHLADVRKHLESVLPITAPASARTPTSGPTGNGGATRPVIVAIYDKHDEFQALWRRVGDFYGGSFGQVATDGFSYRVFCATWYGTEKEFARRQAVLCHEFAHVWLYQNRGLANNGNWLTEGIATAVQLKFFPQSGNRKDFAQWLQAGQMLPLKRLMDLERISPKDYWQAGTLVELLIQKYPGKLPEVMSAFNSGQSANAIVTKVLQTDFAKLQSQWADHVRAGRQVPVQE
jgi:hypothetical protein